MAMVPDASQNSSSLLGSRGLTIRAAQFKRGARCLYIFLALVNTRLSVNRILCLGPLHGMTVLCSLIPIFLSLLMLIEPLNLLVLLFIRLSLFLKLRIVHFQVGDHVHLVVEDFLETLVHIL